jgi:hypothetical protein
VPDPDASTDDGDQVVLRVPADPRYARVVRIATAAHAVRVGLTPPSVEDLRLAVDEALVLLLGAGGTAEDVEADEPSDHIVVTLDATADRPPVTIDLRLEPSSSIGGTDDTALRRFEELIPAGVVVDRVDLAAGRVSLRHAG